MDTQENGGNANTNTAAPKFYLATAKERTPAKGKTAEKMTFVVEGVDYKTAWQNARAVTRFGSDAAAKQEPAINTWTDNKREARTELGAGLWTVEKLDSLQQRSSKQTPVTLDDLQSALEARGVTVSPAIQGLIDELREKGPALAEDAGAPAESAKEDSKDAAAA